MKASYVVVLVVKLMQVLHVSLSMEAATTYLFADRMFPVLLQSGMDEGGNDQI
ncbi:hypothetical protein OK016_11885 [Vibrio chagasii]|nr:hypothetical protein [Vibrio chagasii]